MKPLRILVGNEPEAYRDVLAAALHEILSEARIEVIEPDQLDEAVVTASPDLVFCSRVTEVVDRVPLAWVQLYQPGRTGVVISIGGRRLNLPDAHLDDLLSVVAWTAMIQDSPWLAGCAPRHGHNPVPH